MSILSGYKKFKKYIKTSSGFQLQSLWTSANTVEADDKRTIQTKVGAINGISSSETANSAEIAASTALTNKMNVTINNLSRDFAGGQMEIRLTEAGKGEYRKKGADTWLPLKADPLNVVLKFAVDCTWDGAGHSYLTCSIDGQTFINHYLLPKSVYDETFNLNVKGVSASVRIYVKYSWLDTGDHYDATITVNGFNFLNGTYGWNNTDNEKNIRVLLF